MRDWIVTAEDDRWSVRLDVRDLGRHLDTTFRGWSATLAKRVRLDIARLVLIFVLPLDFNGRLRVSRTMFIPCALHGVVASFLADASVRVVCRIWASARMGQLEDWFQSWVIESVFSAGGGSLVGGSLVYFCAGY